MKKANYPFHVLIKPIGPVCNIACEYCFYLGKEKTGKACDTGYGSLFLF